jgi:hypothetical protein
MVKNFRLRYSGYSDTRDVTMCTPMLKTSGSIGSHTSKFFWSFAMNKLIGYGVEIFTHSYLQGLYYIIYIYTTLKLKYAFIFLLYRSNTYIYIYMYINIKNHIK